MYYFGFSFCVWVGFWSYCSGAYFGFVYSVSVSVVISAVSYVVFFSVCMIGTFLAAVFLSVMGFLEWFSTIGTFRGWVVNVDFHVLPR